VILGKPYGEVRKALEEVSRETGIMAKGFGDLTEDEIASLTGIDRELARLAKQREFAEPFTMRADEHSILVFLKRIEKKGLNWTRGELFHIMGRHDKGKAVKLLKDYYSALYGSIVTIGLGDSSNDIPLLKEVDYPVLVKKPDGMYEPVKLQGVIRAQGVGPDGWNKAVLGILDSIDSSYRGYTC
jgi:mannosyl-3-phosphoglycerate phosphatase